MPLKRRRVLHLVAAGGLAIAGCMGDGAEGGTSSTARTTTATETDTGTGSPSGTGVPTTTADASELTIDMTGSTFGTVRARVEVGATVTWVNRDGVPHTVTSTQFHEGTADWTVDERAGSGESVTYTFGESGVYEYYCTIHGRGTMCGVVLVGDATLDAGLPCEG